NLVKDAPCELFGRIIESVLRGWLGEQSVERLFHLRQRNAVLRTLRAGEAGHDARQIELERLRVVDRARRRRAEQPLRAKVALEGVDLLLRAAGVDEVVDGLVVDGEEAHRG